MSASVPVFVLLCAIGIALVVVAEYSKRGYVFTRAALKKLFEKIRSGEDQEGLSG